MVSESLFKNQNNQKKEVANAEMKLMQRANANLRPKSQKRKGLQS